MNIALSTKFDSCTEYRVLHSPLQSTIIQYGQESSTNALYSVHRMIIEVAVEAASIILAVLRIAYEVESVPAVKRKRNYAAGRQRLPATVAPIVAVSQTKKGRCSPYFLDLHGKKVFSGEILKGDGNNQSQACRHDP